MKYIAETVKEELVNNSLKIVNADLKRPWGGFFVVDEKNIEIFSRLYFADITISSPNNIDALVPKILMIKPGKKLSWQYHLRRSEIWSVIHGEVQVIISDNDEETLPVELKKGDIIKIKQGQRHRLIGLKEWSVIAEIWQHTDPKNASDENDIIRLQDDFGR